MPLILGAIEILRVLKMLRNRRANPNLISVIEELKIEQRKIKGRSKRPEYIDTALLNLERLLDANGSLFRCARGMDLEKLIDGNVVLEVDCLAEDQAFICRYFFLYLMLLSRAGPKLPKPLLYVIDEGQILSSIRNFGQKILQLRHLNVMLSINFQNASTAPIEVPGNSNVLISFQATNQDDREEFGKNAILNEDQTAKLATLERECVCFLPRSPWKSAFLAKVEDLEFVDVTDEQMAKKSQEFAKRFPWIPVQETGQAINAPGEDGSKLDVNAEAFMRDVLNQAHEFSPLTQRWERAGIRSASLQGRILKRVIAQGWVKVWQLAVGRGHPIKLVEPTEKAIEEYQIEWKARGRGTLRTRAATQYLWQKLRKLEGWQWVKEGELSEED